MSFISLFRTQIRTIVYIPIYKGPFDYKRGHTKAYRFPFGINERAVAEEFDEINELRNKEVKEVSPFHLVWRYKPFSGIPWYEKVVLRRLGLHQKEVNVRVVLPNTPHFNQLLWEIKHLIRLKPVSFPNGIPTDEDIGSVKVDTFNGVMNVNRSFRVSNERLEKAKNPDIYYGRYLREYLKWSSGMFGKSLPNIELMRLDGNNIEDYRNKVKNAYKHQHVFYNNKN